MHYSQVFTETVVSSQSLKLWAFLARCTALVILPFSVMPNLSTTDGLPLLLMFGSLMAFAVLDFRRTYPLLHTNLFESIFTLFYNFQDEDDEFPPPSHYTWGQSVRTIVQNSLLGFVVSLLLIVLVGYTPPWPFSFQGVLGYLAFWSSLAVAVTAHALKAYD